MLSTEVVFILGLTRWTITLHGIVWPINIIQKEYFKKFIEVKKSIPEQFKRKYQTLLTGIGGMWYLNDMNDPKPSIKRQRSTKK